MWTSPCSFFSCECTAYIFAGGGIVNIIVSTLRIPTASHRADVLRALRAQLGPTRVQPGCERCDLYQGVEDPDVFTLIEEWASQAELDVRLRSDAYRSVLGALDFSREQPGIQFDTVLKREGVEVIASARALGGQ
jgi:quinol monooxygenase YgiN